ncbi:probable tetraacyldisaccharide 4'-kinase, mitochondrial isoform X2 [Coffea eugenioides]|uniref:probable tetraacyldisaccharide 4'-kinase, mitochondrial isoform X2 n=1 Tax=Coffea eugenioides TaxID=49369 RepID=UPI000F615BB0|nr:probable tetraacyldisaccharide 4'-kinase, mitochondrial isoform X2 [Coffea eugenioides]
MEKLRRLVIQIASTPPSQRFSALSPLQLSLIPLLSIASSIYNLALLIRHRLFYLGIFHKRRLPVPVFSVGNLTWGGNGKTPMVEFVARWLIDSGISPLILTRGYGGGDEAKMLQRHLQGTSAKVGVGANRAATAASFLERHGYLNFSDSTCSTKAFLSKKARTDSFSDKIGVAILDDGMQLWRDLEILMVNGMMPWGNLELIPLGPLREPLAALGRADVVVIHHADLVAEQNIEAIESTVWKVSDSIPIFLTQMAPSYFLKAGNTSCVLSLRAVYDMIVLCVSAIGFPESFVQTILKMGPKHVDRLDFSDHHLFQAKDITVIRRRLKELESAYGMQPIVVVTEKDYDRAPDVLNHVNPYQVLVLCSSMQILPREGRTEDNFKKFLRERLKSLSDSKIT